MILESPTKRRTHVVHPPTNAGYQEGNHSYQKLLFSWIGPIENNWPILLVLVLSLVLNATGITWGLPNYLDWAIDSLSPFTMLEAAYYRFSGGWHSRYPPFHIAILTLFSAPFMGYLMLSGGLKSPNPNFPFGLSDPLATLTHVIFISRIVSVLMGIAMVLVVYLIVRELFDRRSALFSALIVTLSYPLVYYSHTANADVPYLFWALLSLHRYLRVLKKGHLKDYLLFALFGSLSICTKDQAYGLFLLSPLPILWIRFTELRAASPQRLRLSELFFDRRLIAAALVAGVTFVLAHNLIFNMSGFFKHVELITGPASAAIAAYPHTLFGQLQLFWATTLQLSESLTAPLFVLCLAGSLYCSFKFPRYSLPLLFLAVSYYLTFIGLVSYVRLRFVLPISIIIAFFGGKLLADLWDKARWNALMRTAICLIFAYATIFPLQLNLLLLNDPRYNAEEWIQAHFEEGAVVETFAPYSLHKYYPRFPSWVKVRSSRLEAGTRWEPLDSREDSKRLPNLYTGSEAPDYIVLSGLWYSRFMHEGVSDGDASRVLSDLFDGHTDYTLVATFQTPTIVPIHLTVNPRIDIFAKSELPPAR